MSIDQRPRGSLGTSWFARPTRKPHYNSSPRTYLEGALCRTYEGDRRDSNARPSEPQSADIRFCELLDVQN